MRLIRVAVGVLICLMLGCDRAPVTSATTAPASAPSADHAITASATTQPQSSYMIIDQQRVEFPPAKLALRTKGGQVLALLYSDDPPNAIDDTYTGNSFYIEMVLDITDAAQIATARWTFRAPDSERADTSTGIYLDGRKRHLQPLDVSVEFEGGSSPIKVWLSGRFLMFDSAQDPSVPGKMMPIRAELDAELFVKDSNR